MSCTSGSMTIIAQSMLTFTITRASAQHGVYQGIRGAGRVADRVDYPAAMTAWR
jgi:hypothetical protein